MRLAGPSGGASAVGKALVVSQSPPTAHHRKLLPRYPVPIRATCAAVQATDEAWGIIDTQMRRDVPLNSARVGFMCRRRRCSLPTTFPAPLLLASSSI